MQIDPYPGICGPFTLSLLDYNYIYTVSSNLVIEVRANLHYPVSTDNTFVASPVRILLIYGNFCLSWPPEKMSHYLIVLDLSPF